MTTPTDARIEAAAPMTPSAQATAINWLRNQLVQAESLTRTVSGEGEHAEMLATILAMLAAADRVSAGKERAIELLRQGMGDLGNEARVLWKQQVKDFLNGS